MVAALRTDIGGFQSTSDDDLYFYLTNHQFSVVGLTDMYGVVHSRIDYAPYGEAHHRWAGDVNHDGAVDSVDGAAFTSMLSGGKKDIDHPTDYEVDYDLWRGGESAGKSEVNSLDQALWSITWNGLSALPAGDVGTSKTFPTAGPYEYRGTGNTIGFTGHRYDKETGLYLARFRSYAPKTGRWMQRDLAGYVDGMSLYQYVTSQPSLLVDSFGLCSNEQKANICDAWKRANCDAIGSAIKALGAAASDRKEALLRLAQAFAGAGLGISQSILDLRIETLEAVVNEIENSVGWVKGKNGKYKRISQRQAREAAKRAAARSGLLGKQVLRAFTGVGAGIFGAWFSIESGKEAIEASFTTEEDGAASKWGMVLIDILATKSPWGALAAGAGGAGVALLEMHTETKQVIDATDRAMSRCRHLKEAMEDCE